MRVCDVVLSIPQRGLSKGCYGEMGGSRETRIMSKASPSLWKASKKTEGSMRRHPMPLAPSADSSDDVLAQLTLSGNEQAFEALIQRYGDCLSWYITHLSGDPDQVDDILQLVWLQLYLALPVLQGRSSFRSWLFLVARNFCINELRRIDETDVYLSTLERDVDEEEGPSPDFFIDTRPHQRTSRNDMRHNVSSGTPSILYLPVLKVSSTSGLLSA